MYDYLEERFNEIADLINRISADIIEYAKATVAMANIMDSLNNINDYDKKIFNTVDYNINHFKYICNCKLILLDKRLKIITNIRSNC